MRAIVKEAEAELLAREVALKLRQRRRRPADQDIFEQTVAAIISDAAHLHLSAPDRKAMVPLDKRILGRRDRYGSPVLNDKLPSVVQALAELDWIVFEKGHQGFDGPGKRSTFVAGTKLKELMRAAQVDLCDLEVRPGGEVIILKRAKVAHWDNGGTVDYLDTAETRRMREEMEEINRWIGQADLAIDGSLVEETKVDVGDRRLVRVFNNGRFDHGGRLYGGFWQKSKQVRRAVLFGGPDGVYEEAVELDYGQCWLRILYGMAGVQPPEGDLYALPGMEHGRDIVKIVASSLPFGGPDRCRYPKGLQQQFPIMWRFKATEVVGRFLEVHQPVKSLVAKPDIGFHIWTFESKVVLSVLTHLFSIKVDALPIHDAFLAPRSKLNCCASIMAESFYSIVGSRAIISCC